VLLIGTMNYHPTLPVIDISAVAVFCAIVYALVGVRGLASNVVRPAIVAFGLAIVAVIVVGLSSPAVVYGLFGLAGLAFVGVVVFALRAYRCHSPGFTRLVIAALALVIAVLVLLGIVSSVVGYGLLCLALGSVYFFDLLRDEHARRRRIASLTPRPVIEPVLAVWISLAAASLLMLAPYIILDEQRIAAVLVGLCSLAISGIGWRVASAPVALEGEKDLRSEYLCERALRYKKVGISAVIAVGTVFVFVTFVDSTLALVSPMQHRFVPLSFGLWAGLWAWQTLHSRHLDRLSDSAS
jgi:hypothetical protein